MPPKVSVLDAKAKPEDVDVRQCGTRHRQRPELPVLANALLRRLPQRGSHHQMCRNAWHGVSDQLPSMLPGIAGSISIGMKRIRNSSMAPTAPTLKPRPNLRCRRNQTESFANRKKKTGIAKPRRNMRNA